MRQLSDSVYYFRVKEGAPLTDPRLSPGRLASLRHHGYRRITKRFVDVRTGSESPPLTLLPAWIARQLLAIGLNDFDELCYLFLSKYVFYSSMFSSLGEDDDFYKIPS